MIEKGAAVVSLIDVLEAHNKRVGITILSCVSNYTDNDQYQIFIPLKKPEHHIDKELLVFAIAHPSTFRRLIFSVEEQAESMNDIRRYGFDGGSYGHPSFKPKVIPEGVIYVDGSVYGKHIGSEWIRQQLAKYNIKVRE